MVLHIHSDASYISAPKSQSRASGHYLLSDRFNLPQQPPATMTRLNGPIHTFSKIMRYVMASAAEAEIGATFINVQESIHIRSTLEELGHPQPPTPICVNKSTASGFSNDNIKQKRLKAIDMRFYWVQDWTLQNNFLSIGNREIIILVLTAPSTARPPIIVYCGRPICTQPPS